MPHIPAIEICELLDRYTAVLETRDSPLAETVARIGSLVAQDDLIDYCRAIQSTPGATRDDATATWTRMKHFLGREFPRLRRPPVPTVGPNTADHNVGLESTPAEGPDTSDSKSSESQRVQITI